MKDFMTDAECYCIAAITEATIQLKYNRKKAQEVGERAAAVLLAHAQEIESMYADSKQQLKEWILRQVGLEDAQIEQTAKRLGLTGDPLRDYATLQEDLR